MKIILIREVTEGNKTIKEASRLLNMNRSTAKVVLRKHRDSIKRQQEENQKINEIKAE
jgi:hypothetical protein